MYVAAELRKKLLPLKDVAVANFTKENWLELGTITNCLDIIQGHDRLLRSLYFNDEDYAGCSIEVLIAILERENENFGFIEDYIAQRFDTGGTNISSIQSNGTKVYFQPTVFKVPDDKPDAKLVSVMMPFTGNFDAVYQSIEQAATQVGLFAERADNIWKESALIQDIFGLIFRSNIVVCDFSGKNPNVFYEAGIAHTLGKHVIPITQSPDDIPFDLRHHRYIHYLNNAEGREKLKVSLRDRMNTLSGSAVGNCLW